MIDPSAILSILVSFIRMIDTSSLRRHIFCSGASRYSLVAQLVGIALSAFPRPVVQTNDVWLWWGRLLRLANQAQDGISTATDAQFASKVCPCLTPVVSPNWRSASCSRFVR